MSFWLCYGAAYSNGRKLRRATEMLVVAKRQTPQVISRLDGLPAEFVRC